MKTLGVGAVGLGGLGLANSSSAQVSGGGPPDTGDWSLVMEDDFDSGSLDSSLWDVGWGWGRETNNGPAGVRDHAIRFEDSLLVLDILDDGRGSPYSVGGINTKDKVTIGPGSYVEARIRTSDLPGSNSAFWGKPNTEAWPPEIDFMESLMSSYDRRNRTSHNIHWTTDGQPNGPHATENLSRHPGYDHSRRFTDFGCRWLDDSITMYADGEAFERVTDSAIMRSLNNGAQFYIMLNTIVAGWMDGTPDDWSPYKTTMEVDWIRVWEASNGGGGSTGGSDSDSGDDSSDGGDPDATDTYLWVRSSNEEPVTFAFRASGGNIRLDSSGHEADFWIAEDGETAGGTTDRTIGIPGFWFDGEITDFSYDGPIEVYVSDERVDPDTLVDASTEGPGESEEYPRLSNTLTIDGRSSSASYSVSVSDRIDVTESTADETVDSETSVSGSVSGGVHEYTYDGSITDLSLDGDAEVYRNGSRVNLLVIARDPESGSVTYLVESSGRLVKADVPGASINDNDRLSGGKVLGTVVGGRDAYWVIDGGVIDVSTYGGEVVTELDGEEVDLTD